MAFATETYIIKGMRQDDSDLLANASSEGLQFAFENLNMRFTPDGATTLLVGTQEKGNRQIESIKVTPNFFETLEDIQQIPFFEDLPYLPFVVVGACVVDRYLVVFGKCVDGYHGSLAWEEGNDIVLRIERTGGIFYGWLLYAGKGLDFRMDMPLETMGNVESNIVKKVYFVDGVHGPRAVNVVNRDAGQLSNIELGFDLKLDDVLAVNKEHNVKGNYPMGKVRFFYTYYNDTYSETPIVDWSPFFDCNYTNQGGAPDSQHTTEFAFKIRIGNVDTRFKYVRIYMQHFTSPDPAVYTLKYIERPISGNVVSYVFRYDETDAINADKTYLDIRSAAISFIPYTMAEQNNRMFYGNIRKGLPDTRDISFEDKATVSFVDKLIGEEKLDTDITYKYKPDQTTFKGSNYDYMGFRKDNWYRFGIIAQYKTGEWSEVFFIGDANCDISSRTEITYHEPVFVNGYADATTKPKSALYYIPKAVLNPKSSFVEALQTLYDRGFKRIKPVCCVPPPENRDVLTQGIVCATTYVGGERRLARDNKGLFAMPSHFFRPTPLFQKDIELKNGDVMPIYPYTIRDVTDQTILNNIKSGGDWLLNPSFTDERYMNFNTAYREYRHGLSLPPKDRINAELQCSDVSISDYHYMDGDKVSRLFSEYAGFDLFCFHDTDEDDIVFKAWEEDMIVDRDDEDWLVKIVNKYRTLPWHSIHTTGYDSTVFVDESICTINSPEIDITFRENVEPWFGGGEIEVVGYAQVTGSMSAVDIPKTKFEQTVADAEGLLSNDSLYGDTIGESLYSIAISADGRMDLATSEFVKSLFATRGMRGEPFVPTCGPWWLDTMLVASFKHITYTNNDTHPMNNIKMFESANITDGSGNTWNFSDKELYSEHDGTPIINKDNAFAFARAFDEKFVPPTGTNRASVFRWTTSFYGETTKVLAKAYSISAVGTASYPYSDKQDKGKAVIFSEFIHNVDFGINGWISPNGERMFDDLSVWSMIPMTWNTIVLTLDYKNDGYWNKFRNNRSYMESDYDNNFTIGNVTIPYDSTIATQLTDPQTALDEGDFRSTFTYYFNPFEWFTATRYPNVRFNHPVLLPHSADNPDSRMWVQDTYTTLVAIDPAELQTASAFEEHPAVPWFDGSKYGCHYYAPFSTNFIGAYFDPYYAHVVYPFMSDTTTPFCGSNDAYRAGTAANVRPSYNVTGSCLYSCCTNYMDVTPSHWKTYSAYYHAPNVTQEYRPEPSLSSIPFVDSDNTGITRLYSYNCSDSAVIANIPILSHSTFTLTAAMKWYRGFKHLCSTSSINENDKKLISTGSNLDEAAIAGDLIFSGYMPQLFTHCGLLSPNEGDKDNWNYKYVSDKRKPDNPFPISDGKKWFEGLDDFLSNNYRQLVSLDYLPTPHIVFYCDPQDDNLGLMPRICGAGITEFFGMNFVPQYYYKEFINERYPQPAWYQDHNDHIKHAYQWMMSTYPHSGHFEPYNFNALSEADNGQPYWNAEGVMPKYPFQTERRLLGVDFADDKFVKTDDRGQARRQQDYWVLPIANIYNTKLIEHYGNKNPYTIDNVSVEQWSWKMCGYTMRIADLLDTTTATVKLRLEYLEGDTYFQRYNCFKSVSKDTAYSMIWGASDNDNEASPGVNDVTDTASVMIESYINLDGLYWEYENTIDRVTTPLLHPYYANMNQINPVYSIQNGICDDFRQVDYNYYNAELKHFPTMILWSIQKHDGEVNDSWGIVPATNKMLVSGEYGAINKMLRFADKVYSIQEHAVSILNYNPQVIEPTNTGSTLSVYLSDSTRLQDVTYINRTTGTLNKWSVAVGQRGFYWVDETLRRISAFIASSDGSGVADLSSAAGFDSWCNENISSEGCLWTADTYLGQDDGVLAIKSHVDIESNDVYWSFGKSCLCYNETLECFTSFYDYGKTSWKLNWHDRKWSLYCFDNITTLWEDQCNYTHTIYDHDVDNYVDILVNPSGQTDKVFNFIEYNAEAYLPDSDTFIERMNPWTHIGVTNTYQFGHDSLNSINTKERFRLWRTSLPREIKNGRATMNRIRGPWCRIRLGHVGGEGHIFAHHFNEYRDKLYYVNVNYTIPEQPLKSNIQQRRRQ